MAMLAEPRQKSSYVLMPRGKPLYEDSSRFGTRMLEKMGWSKGNGLGPNENGKMDFVRLTYKNGFTGLGYEDKNDEWTGHEEVFSGLLKSLNSSTNVPNTEENSNSSTSDSVLQVPRESLEEKSKKSKARVHYKKYTKGKDLSQYSEQDLANIFGRKSLNEFTAFKAVSAHPEESFKFGVPTVETGKSMHDYFKSKMQLKKITYEQPANESKDLSEVDYTVNDISSPSSNETKKNKKNKKDKECEIAVAGDVLDITEENNVDIEMEETHIYKKNKKHKKDKHKDHSAESQTTEISTDSKKKSKKHKNSVELDDNQIGKLDNIVYEEPTIEYSTKPKNKKRKHQESDHSIEVNNEEVCRKNKKKDKTMLDSTLEEINTLELSIKRKHKKRISEEIITFKDCMTQPTLEDTEKPLKKKKKKECAHDTIITEPKDGTNPDTFEQKITKIKKSKKTKNELPPEIVNEKPSKATEQLVKNTAESNMVENIEMVEKSNFKNSENFIINSYVAEKFRYTNLDGFEGSNIKSLVGYGIPSNFKLIVVEKPSDETKIANMWDEAVNKCNKYEDEKEDKAESGENIQPAPKIKFGQLKRKMKRKSYFAGI